MNWDVEFEQRAAGGAYHAYYRDGPSTVAAAIQYGSNDTTNRKLMLAHEEYGHVKLLEDVFRSLASALLHPKLDPHQNSVSVID